MTNEEVVEVLESIMTNSHIPNEIEAMQTAIEAIDAQTPKKPYLNHDVSTIHINKGDRPHECKKIESDNWHCPICNWFVAEHLVLPNGKEHTQRKKEYCDRCGQRIDWSEYDKRRSY